MATPQPADAPTPLLRMRELAEASGVSAGTIKHYLREGLLPEPVRTSRNMAYYPPEFVERIRLIKQLQEERFLPLKVIRDLLEEEADESPERLRALIELEDRIIERALAGDDEGAISRAEAGKRYELPDDVLDRLEELDIVSRERGRYSAEDARILEAISRMRAGGYSEQLGFTVHDAILYRESLEILVRREVATLMERLVGEMPADEAVELIKRGAEPIRDLIVAMRQKLLVAELRRHRAARGEAGGG